MIKRKYIVLLMVTLVSIPLAGLLYSNLVRAQSTVTSYVSVPAAAFVPWDNTKNWRNNGYNLYNLEDSGWAYFAGALQLPHGATVTNFTTYWYDIGTNRTECYLLKGTKLGDRCANGFYIFSTF